MKCYTSVTKREGDSPPATAGQSKAANIPLRILVTVKRRFGKRHCYVLCPGAADS